MYYTEDEYKTAYNDLMILLADYMTCDLVIPQNWSITTLECINNVTSICPSIMMERIHKVDGKLVIDYTLDASDEYCRAYIDDEIHYANLDIPKENEMLGLNRSTVDKCSICGALVTQFTKVVGDNGKDYCKPCHTKLNPPTLIVRESATGIKFIDKTVAAKLNINDFRESCKWFLRRKIIDNSGARTYYFEYRGEKICRQFIDKEKDLPSFWTRCPQYGKCPF